MVKICKIWHNGKERTEISVLIERKNSVRGKQNEWENRIIWNFSESFLHQTNLISGSTDPTDSVSAESRKK